jgi:hypothetical protein
VNYYKFSSAADIPVLIIVGNLDTNTQNGLGAWYKDGFGDTATLLTLPTDVLFQSSFTLKVFLVIHDVWKV